MSPARARAILAAGDALASLTIRLVVDPRTGKKNIVVSYTSDTDALPMEHEEAHRRLVDQLIEGGALRAAEVGAVIVEREGAASPAQEAEEAPPSGAAEGLKHKG